MKMRRLHVFAATLCAAAAATAVVLAVAGLFRGERASSVQPDLGEPDDSVPEALIVRSDPDAELLAALSKSASDDETLRVLQLWAQRGVPLSRLPSLRRLLFRDSDLAIRGEALGIALQLAALDGRGAETALLREAVSCPSEELRTVAVRACKGFSDPELADLLIENSDLRPLERYLVIDALATMDNDAARARVLSAAMDEKLARAERMRAIALLSKTRNEEAVSYLIDLAKSDDLELKRLAIEVLNSIQRDIGSPPSVDTPNNR